MSVTTTADEKLQETKDHLWNAYKSLMVVLDPNTWGHEDYKQEYIEKLHTLAMKMLELKKYINP